MNDRDGSTPNAFATGRRKPRRTPRRAGSVVGGFVGGALLATLWVLYEVDARSDQDAAPHDVGISVYWFVLWLAVAATGFLVAIVVTARRATRNFGEGMLLGLSLTFAVLFAVLLLQGLFTPS